jgi:shikimate kinase
MLHPPHKVIFLTGFMGSGKSTLAPILANTLGFDHTDLDLEVERTTRSTVNEIFRQQGELSFRVLEGAALSPLISTDNVVISLGGGTLANEGNRKLIFSSGIVIYVQASLEQIVQRMKNKVDRPLLRHADGSRLNETELRTKIEALFAEREPHYLQADIIIPTDMKHVGATVEEILKQLRLKTDLKT